LAVDQGEGVVHSRAPLGSITYSRETGIRGTSVIRKYFPVGPYRRTMPRLLW